MEILALRSSITQAKIMGTIASISGAMVVVFYKGPTIISASPESPSPSLLPLDSSQTNWIIGGLLLAAEYLLFSISFIVQTQVMKSYPAELIVVSLYNLCGTIISAPVCLLAEGNLSAWRLRPDIALVAILYSGFASALFTVVHIWGLHLKGPVYVSNFKPLSIGHSSCNDCHIPCVIGAIILSIGFYAVIWAKAKEELREEYCCGSLGSSSDGKTPLLDSYKVEGM
uniref:WAT1-related protein n=1 Tax=Fagus sylvatica TaxID=28930 RepID=A0A2N9FJZ1_FAGSY